MYKIRLVIKDFTQTDDINYQKIFALVAKMNMVRIFFLIMMNKG
jgi:hypothetical protein